MDLDQSPLFATLVDLRGARVYFDKMWGNNGDDLNAQGSYHLLQQAGLGLVDNPRSSDVIVVRGAGYSSGPNSGLEHFGKLLTVHADKPAILMPSSFRMAPDYLVPYLTTRQAPTTLWARERVSRDMLERLARLVSISVAIDHDLALYLAGTPFVHNLIEGTGPDEHVLVVERGDAETVTGFRASGLGPPWIKRIVPNPVLEGAKRIHRRFAYRDISRTAFAQRAILMLRREHPELAQLPLLAGDISDTSICTFEEFCTAIARAGAVCTTRLHVGVLAAILNKPTYLQGGSFGGTYRKLEGVFDYSLASMKHVHLLSGQDSLI